jgi:hypothetical protein
MHFVHGACAAHTEYKLRLLYRYATAIHCVFQAASLPPEHTFLQQLKKVAKKSRSPARLSLRLLTKLCRPLLAVPYGEKLNWLSLPIDLQNLTNNRRTLSREKAKAQLRCQRRWPEGQPTKAKHIVVFVGGALAPKLLLFDGKDCGLKPERQLIKKCLSCSEKLPRRFYINSKC